MAAAGGREEASQWDSRQHFLAAAAEAMRRILIENARRKQAIRHGGSLHRTDMELSARLARATPENDYHRNCAAMTQRRRRVARISGQKRKSATHRFLLGLPLEAWFESRSLEPNLLIHNDFAMESTRSDLGWQVQSYFILLANGILGSLF